MLNYLWVAVGGALGSVAWFWLSGAIARQFGETFPWGTLIVKGFGKSSRLHTAKILRLSMDLPLVIKIVDSEERIQSFLPVLDKMMGGGLLTMEKVKVMDYRGKEPTS